MRNRYLLFDASVFLPYNLSTSGNAVVSSSGNAVVSSSGNAVVSYSGNTVVFSYKLLPYPDSGLIFRYSLSDPDSYPADVPTVLLFFPKGRFWSKFSFDLVPK